MVYITSVFGLLKVTEKLSHDALSMDTLYCNFSGQNTVISCAFFAIESLKACFQSLREKSKSKKRFRNCHIMRNKVTL